mgnify:CR=1 FL=1
MAINPQNNLKKIMEINDVINQYVNKNWIIGCYVDIITKNTNSQYRLSYNQKIENKDLKKFNKAKALIDKFNKQKKCHITLKIS